MSNTFTSPPPREQIFTFTASATSDVKAVDGQVVGIRFLDNWSAGTIQFLDRGADGAQTASLIGDYDSTGANPTTRTLTPGAVTAPKSYSLDLGDWLAYRFIQLQAGGGATTARVALLLAG